MDLRNYIESRKFEQKEFAKMIGVSVRTLANYLSGKRMPNLFIVYKIIDVTEGKVGMRDLIDLWERKNGKNLKTYIESRNFEKKEFAQMIGVTAASLGNYINGKRMPNPKAIKNIIDVTKGKVTLDDLVTYWMEKKAKLQSEKE